MTSEKVHTYLVNRMAELWEAGNNAYNLVSKQPAENTAIDHRLKMTCDEYANHIYYKLLAARAKYGFNPLGWATPDWKEELQAGLIQHVFKGDPRDVGAYAMLAWFHGWSTAPQDNPEAEAVAVALADKLTQQPSADEAGLFIPVLEVTALLTELLTAARVAAGHPAQVQPQPEPEDQDQAARLRWKTPARNLHYLLHDVAQETSATLDNTNSPPIRKAIQDAFLADQQQRDNEVAAALRAQLSGIEKYDEPLRLAATALGLTL